MLQNLVFEGGNVAARNYGKSHDAHTYGHLTDMGLFAQMPANAFSRVLPCVLYDTPPGPTSSAVFPLGTFSESRLHLLKP